MVAWTLQLGTEIKIKIKIKRRNLKLRDKRRRLRREKALGSPIRAGVKRVKKLSFPTFSHRA